MNQEDLPSDSDTEDEDYCPVNDSGSESIDEKNNSSGHEEDGETTKTKKKRKRGRKTKNKGTTNNDPEEVEEKNKTVVDSEAEKKRVEALWADFLSGTEIPIKPKESTSIQSSAKSSTSKIDIPKTQKSTPSTAPKIFEFAGETVEISQNGSCSSENSSKNNVPLKSTAVPTNSLGLKRPSTGGLSSVLNQLSKKNKLSVLEKTKLDWDGFKSNEGIAEELKTHNKGRDGFLERRDFLERTDLRQFEIEKSIRMSSKRNNK